jgi:DNA-binding NtrC family response regulator
MARILCVDDEPAALAVFRSTLEEGGHDTVQVRNIEAALTVLGRGGIDLVLSDYQMPEGTGLELLAEVRRRELSVPLVMITGYGSIEHAVAAMKSGAVDYVTKPVRPQQLNLVVEHALEFHRLRSENQRLRDEVELLRGRRELIGDSAPFRRILDTLTTVAPTRSTVLLQGESGTGKELLARTLHNLSDRRDGPFVSVNCAALPENLVESTLFGHEKGAFTGAVKRVRGAFERAHRGTLLLDEVSEMRPDLQAKLLRVLQEREFERVGGHETIEVDVRVIATTNRDLAHEVAVGTFREDLYYRLSVVPVRVPPLRERMDDVPRLVRYFTERTARDTGKAVPEIAADTMELLQRYHWPGNVRELAHAVERAVILSPGATLGPEAFDPARFGLAFATRQGGPGQGPVPSSRGAPSAEGPVFLDTLDIRAAEERLIERALQQTDQNRTRAAELLGISVRTLRNKLNSPD